MIKQSILTNTEKKVIQKKLNNEKLTKQDSYYLSFSIRPKLREMISMDPELLIDKLRYDQRTISTENKIKSLILGKIKGIKAIVLYGSAIQTNYSRYNDIDVLIVTKNKLWKNPRERYSLIKSLGSKELNLDVNLITEKELNSQYPHNPSLIYQLKDRKVIYGKINLPKKIELYNADLKMKIDWSDIQDNSAREIYLALRNVILVKLLIKKIIDNKILEKEIEQEIGQKTLENLKNNRASEEEKNLAKLRLKNSIEKLESELGGDLWEKKVQLTV